MKLPASTTTTPAEARVLARRAAAAYRGMIEAYKKDYKLSHGEAVAKAAETDPAEELQCVLHGPPEQVSWLDLERLGEHDPGRMLGRWEEVKRAALEESRNGERAAQAVEGHCPSPWQRAQFAATFTELTEGWQPRGGVERLLLSQMAVAHTMLLDWTAVLAHRTSGEVARQGGAARQPGPWEPPTLPEAEAVEQASAMVDRFSRIFLRSLRALCNLRRAPVAVVVQNAGQLNVGAQQVNTRNGKARRPGGAAGARARPACRRPLPGA